MDIKDLQYFLTVVEAQNITKAAEILHISQPPLSRQIKLLEEELGVKLIKRSSGKKNIELTTQGILLSTMAKEMLGLRDKIITQIQEIDLNQSGKVYLGCIGSTTYKILPQNISAFKSMFPNITFELCCSNADELIQKLEKGQIDAAILLRPNEIESFDYFVIGQEFQVATMLPELQLAKSHGNTVSVRQLSKYPLILPSRTSIYKELNRRFLEEKLSPNILLTYTTSLSIIPLVEQGLGIAIIPRSAAIGVESRGLIWKRISPSISTPLVMIRKKNVPHTEACNLFFDFVKKQYSFNHDE